MFLLYKLGRAQSDIGAAILVGISPGSAHKTYRRIIKLFLQVRNHSSSPFSMLAARSRAAISVQIRVYISYPVIHIIRRRWKKRYIRPSLARFCSSLQRPSRRGGTSCRTAVGPLMASCSPYRTMARSLSNQLLNYMHLRPGLNNQTDLPWLTTVHLSDINAHRRRVFYCRTRP